MLPLYSQPQYSSELSRTLGASRMRFGSGVLAVLLGLQATSVLAADCAFQPFSTVPGADVSLQWTARSGRPCELLLRVGNGTGATRMLVVQQAANGTAATPTLSSIRYVSRPGFVGRDRFVIERTAESMARRVIRGTAHWTIDVNVVP